MNAEPDKIVFTGKTQLARVRARRDDDGFRIEGTFAGLDDFGICVKVDLSYFEKAQGSSSPNCISVLE